MIQLEPHSRGVILPVRAQPRARRSAILGEHAGQLKIAVTDPPEKGKANQSITKVLCEQLALKKSQVVLLSGETSRAKRFLVVGINTDELLARLSCVCESVSR